MVGASIVCALMREDVGALIGCNYCATPRADVIFKFNSSIAMLS